VPEWTFLTNHAHVLLCIARDPQARLRDVAAQVGITERAAQRIVAELGEAGYLTVTRDGRRNRYEVHPEVPLRHPVERDHAVGEILAVLRPARGDAPGPG
jgi:DNA-binding transcriptional ArsR family regulator